MTSKTTFALLRGVCQTPAYVATDEGFFRAEGIEPALDIAPTAWVVPQRLMAGQIEFAVIPWTRVAAASSRDEDLVVLCGSGHEEAALVVREGLALEDVRVVAVPQEGGIKDLTAAGLIRSLALPIERIVRQPSGDGAILSFVGQGCDAAVMVEPWASMLEHLGLGRVVRRTGDVWPGAPGCSLATSRRLLREEPDLVRRVVRAYVRGAAFVEEQPERAAEVAARYIGVSGEICRKAFHANRPNVRALHNTEAMGRVLSLMRELGYIARTPEGFAELAILDEVLAESATV